MAHRTILTDRQRAALFGLPADEATHLRFHVLGDQDIALIRRRRRPSAETLAHVSPLAWEHITLTGEYRWERATGPASDP
jgi:hypothetical protein